MRNVVSRSSQWMKFPWASGNPRYLGTEVLGKGDFFCLLWQLPFNGSRSVSHSSRRVGVAIPDPDPAGTTARIADIPRKRHFCVDNAAYFFIFHSRPAIVRKDVFSVHVQRPGASCLPVERRQTGQSAVQSAFLTGTHSNDRPRELTNQGSFPELRL